MATVNKVLIKDDRLVCSPDMTFAVVKGAMNNTVVPYEAISGANGAENPTSITWNIQVPSEQIIIDRRVMVEATITMEYKKTQVNQGAAGAGVGNSELVWSNGDSVVNLDHAVSGADALNYFPFHQLITTAQININNTAVSLNVQDVLPALVRFNDSRDLNEYNGTTPIQVDKYNTYGATIKTVNHITAAAAAGTAIMTHNANSPFSAYGSSLDEAFVSRGSFPVRFVNSLTGTDTVAPAMTVGGAVGPPAVAFSGTQFVRFTVREPLMVSPFTFCNPQQNSQGIYGVQNLAITLNLGNYNRLVRARPQLLVAGDNVIATTTTVSKIAINSCRLLMNFLTPQPSDLLVPRNVVPYYDIPRYFSGALAVSAGNWNTAAGAIATYGTPSSIKFTFNALQLNQIPDKLIIFARPKGMLAYNSNTACSDHFLPIRRINMNFNNQSGLLSTWTQQELYRASRENGCNQSWYEWSGLAQSAKFGIPIRLTQLGVNSSAAAINFFPGTPYGADQPSITIPTTGSLLVLCFGKDIEIPDYFAPGSAGNFNLQFELECDNYGLGGGDYEVCVLTLNAGIFATEKGNSYIYTGLLTKEDVLQASSMEPITQNDFKRMVGGGFWDSLKTIGSKVWRGVKSALPVASQVANAVAPMLGQYGAPIAQGLSMANKLAGNGMAGAAMGYGMSEDAGKRVVGGRRRSRVAEYAM